MSGENRAKKKLTKQNTTTPDEERNLWRTPPPIFRWLDARFHFEIDLAADPFNALKMLYFSEKRSALEHKWMGYGGATRGFCNPPYSDIDPWMAKAAFEAKFGFTTVMLVPLPNGEERWSKYVYDFASEIIDFDQRIAFIRPDGSRVPGNTRGSCVVIYEPWTLRRCYRYAVSRDAIMEDWADECLRQVG